MKFGSVLFALGVAASLLVSARAQGSPDDLYLEAYELIQDADQLARSGQSDRARERYNEATANLKKLQTTYPNYSKSAVEYRVEYVADRMKTLPIAEQPPRPAPAVTPLPEPAENDPKALLQRIQSLQSENALLQAKLQEALAPKPASADPAEFARAQERINQLEKEKALIRAQLEQAQAKQPQAGEVAMLNQVRGELEATKKQLVNNVAAVATLTQERNTLREEKGELEKKLAAASPTNHGSSSTGELESLKNEVANLRARLSVYEAKKVPFTAEEMALLKKEMPNLVVDAKPARTAPRELPPGAGLILTEARRLFAQGRFAEAEAKYKQVLEMDQDNPLSLANLAAIQLELQKLSEADANLKRALELSPEDPYSLSLLGMLRFQQGKYDQALDALSRSAQIDPKNPETQNYLGITLSQRGQREAAETALRKAITLNPNYAGAHHNLAVIYATQKPPFLELARFHYNKARTLGQGPNPDLEKQLGL